MSKTAIQFFLIILAGAICAAVLGGIFGAVIGLLAPDFAGDLFAERGKKLPHPVNYSASVGMVFGLFIGAAVACFSCGLSAILRLRSLKVDLSSGGAGNSPED